MNTAVVMEEEEKAATRRQIAEVSGQLKAARVRLHMNLPASNNVVFLIVN
jgi:hypothetical protein